MPAVFNDEAAAKKIRERLAQRNESEKNIREQMAETDKSQKADIERRKNVPSVQVDLISEQ